MKPQPSFRPVRRQRGFALIGTAIAVAVWMTAFYSMVRAYAAYLDQEGARISGIKIAEYNSAVSAFINGSLPNVPIGTFNGTAWLKDAATCPGATGAVAYLPCSFTDFVGMNLAGYSTTITNNNPPFYRAVTTVGAVLTDGRPDGGLGGSVVRAAESWIGMSGLRQQAEHQVGIPSYDINPNNAIITATVDTATNADAWLRRDGSNAMAGDLNAGGFNVNNARDVNANRDMSAGRNVIANTANAGGDVLIANSNIWGLGPISLAGAEQGSQVVALDFNGQAVITQPQCPGALIPKIQGVFVQLHDNGIASPIGYFSVRSRPVPLSNPAEWTVIGELSTAADQTNHPARNARAVITVSCKPN